MAVAPATRRAHSARSGGAEVTGPDFVLTSGAQVAPTCGAVARGPRRASGARASAAVGAMSFLVLRSRSSRCQRLSVERPPVHATARSNPATTHHHSRTPQRHSRESGNPGWGPRLEGSGSPPPPTSPSTGSYAKVSEGGNPGWRRGAGHPSPHRASDPRHTRRGKEAPMPAGGRRPGPAGDHAACPHQEQPPSSPICGRHPLGQPAQQGTQTAVNQRRTIQQPRQGCPRQETIAVLPPGQLQKTTKNTKQSYKGRLIKQHFC